VRFAANAEVVFLVRNKRRSGSVLPQQFAKDRRWILSVATGS